jgi:hypothetical protein
MADVFKTVLPALVIPLLLIVMVSVYMQSTDSTSFVWENTVTNESAGTADGDETVTSANHCKPASVTAVYNGTDACALATCYTVTYTPLGTCDVWTNATAGSILISYTGYTGDGYSAFDKMNDSAYSGFKLGSVLPYVIIAMAVLGIIVMAFKF